jgi:hypothetical protein
MKMRLSGWQRIGIVASVIWVIGGGFWGNTVGLSQGEYVRLAYEQCLHARIDTGWEPCHAKFEKDWPEAIKDHWYYAAAFAFIPIPLAWLVVWGMVSLVRWIRAGFTQ